MTNEEARIVMLCTAQNILGDFAGKPMNEGAKHTYEALDKAIEALEKQIPKKPKISGVTTKDGVFHPINGIDGVPYELCPSCETNLCTTGILAEKRMRYCEHCGQAIDWSEEG